VATHIAPPGSATHSLAHGLRLGHDDKAETKMGYLKLKVEQSESCLSKTKEGPVLGCGNRRNDVGVKPSRSFMRRVIVSKRSEGERFEIPSWLLW
jgi:hypothetical protein